MKKGERGNMRKEEVKRGNREGGRMGGVEVERERK